MKKNILTLSFVFPLIAGDIMVERMQSVVDEVSELRKRYEDSVHKNEKCLSQVKKQNELLSQKGLSPLADAKKIMDLTFENARLKQENVRLNELELEINQLNKENKRLIKELSLSEQTVQNLEKRSANLDRKLQTTISSSTSNASTLASFVLLQEKNKKLLEDLKTCENFSKAYVKRVKSSEGICIDDNPFPKLLKKEKKTEPEKFPKKLSPLIEDMKTSGVYRIKGESAVYDKPKGTVIEIWEDTRSFTSNISKDNWVKITGFFVDRKWRKAKFNMWVERKDTSER